MCSRGCPFHCSYCINTKLNELHNGKGKPVRYRSIENIITEIKGVASKYPRMKQVEFHDDTFTLRKEWLKEFCRAYKSEIGLPFACNVRPGTIDNEIPLLLKEANCTEVRIGIEAGNDFIRNKILKRNLSKENIIKDFKKFKDIGIRTWAFNMIGIPYETVSMIEETISLNKQVKADFAQVSIFVPYPGTETMRICEENGWLTDRTTETYFQNESPIDQPTLTVQQVAYYNRIFRWKVMYPKILPLIDLLCRIPIGKNRVAYDSIFPLIKKLYRFIKYRRDVSKLNTQTRVSTVEPTIAANETALPFEKGLLEEKSTFKNNIKRRCFQRVNASSQTEFKSNTPHNREIVYNAVIENLSEGGFLISHINAFKNKREESISSPEMVGRELREIKFSLNDDARLIETNGECVWETNVNGKRYAGVRFKNMEQIYNEMIKDYVQMQQNN
jgi:uncharacterized radical SAM superfamily protein